MTQISQDRIRNITTRFEKSFKSQPQLIVNGPGRVNLIGEHTDYNGLPVLPMAIERSITIAVAATDENRVELKNARTSFASRKFALEEIIHPYPDGDWGNFAKAAVHSLMQHGRLNEELEWDGWSGCQMLVDGDVPLGAGLSSSSALVVALALAFLSANKREMDPLKLADLMAEGERFVGTAGGGMDQAISLCAKEGSALKIDFFPLDAIEISLPESLDVVIADSLEVADKSGSARPKYNRRPIECALALAILKKQWLQHSSHLDAQRLGDLLQTQPNPDALNSFIDTSLNEQPYSVKEIAEALETSPKAIVENFLTDPEGVMLADLDEKFPLKARVRHVFSEAQRVSDAAIALTSGDVEKMGELMTGSHNSCRDDYEISTEDLDELVTTALDGGALGARLTGAGFGGCVVSIVPSDQTDDFINHLREDYYDGYLGIELEEDLPNKKTWNDVIFATSAAAGAEVLVI